MLGNPDWAEMEALRMIDAPSERRGAIPAFANSTSIRPN
tara:strand:+ start:4836 stop:4952 length:117 start_codon:yes stop_codon:yes gene_type:complete